MYYEFFGFREPPFAIAPDPRYLYLSERHREALAHLMYGVKGQGGFIVITGEVGTGKTTLCRGFIENVPENVDIAMVLNPRLSARELLSSICDELGLRHPTGSTIKRLIDLINHELLESHAAGRHKVLIIDEAQNLSADVLEQLRLLTNLETAEKKLLQIVLLGQPELRDILARPELRQLAQRVTARYHLDAIDRTELPAYIRYRLHVAGQQSELFDGSALRMLYRRSGGIPRVINLICDRALLGAYSENTRQIGSRHIRQAAKEVLGNTQIKTSGSRKWQRKPVWAAIILATMAVVLSWATFSDKASWLTAGTNDSSQTTLADSGPSDLASPVANPAGQSSVDSAASELSGQVLRKTTVSTTDNQQKYDRTPSTTDDGKQSEQTAAGSDKTVAGDPTTSARQQALSNPDWLEQVGKSGTSKREAYRALLAQWGFDYDASESPYACDFAESVGLRCLHRQGNWRSIEQLNRPAILKLFDSDGEVRHVTLTQLTEGTATIIHGDGPWELTRANIDRYWLGDYSLVWRVPPYDSRLVPDDEPVSKEAWLSSKLMQLIASDEQNSRKQDELMAAPLKAQVRWFQSKNNLVRDGVVGAKTLIEMNRNLYPSVPTLTPRGKQTAEVR